MFCPKCGKENKEDAKFCKGCGGELKPAVEEKIEPKTEVKPEKREEAEIREKEKKPVSAIKKPKRKPVIIAAVILLMIAALVGGLFLFDNWGWKLKEKLFSLTKEGKIDRGEPEKITGETTGPSPLAIIQPQEGYVGNEEIKFNQNGRVVTYAARQNDGKYAIFINEKKSAVYDSFNLPMFISPDGGNVIYTAGRNGKMFVVANGKEGKAYDAVYTIIFSPVSQSIAYISREGEKEFVVINDQEGKRYDNVNIGKDAFLFSPDGKKVAYMAFQGQKQFVVINDQESSSYDYVVDNLVFSPDSQKLAYIVTKEGKPFIVINHQEYRPESWPYDVVKSLAFTLDSKELWFIVHRNERWLFDSTGAGEGSISNSDSLEHLFFNKGNGVCFVASQSGKQFIDYTGLRSNSYDSINPKSIALSPVGDELAYVVGREGSQFVVINDWTQRWRVGPNGEYEPIPTETTKEGRVYDAIDSQFLIFSFDGAKIAYVAEQGGKQFVVVNEKEGKMYDGVFELTFSPDGQKITYGARSGNELWWIIDSVE